MPQLLLAGQAALSIWRPLAHQRSVGCAGNSRTTGICTHRTLTTYGHGLPQGVNCALTGAMTSWTPEELRSIGSTDDFHISLFRADRTTLGTPTWIGPTSWTVQYGEGLVPGGPAEIVQTPSEQLRLSVNHFRQGGGEAFSQLFDGCGAPIDSSRYGNDTLDSG